MPITSFPTAGTIGSSLLPSRWDVVIYEGDTFDYIFSFFDSNHVGVSLSGFTPLMEVKNSSGAVVVTPQLTPDFGGSNGMLRVFFQTDDLAEGVYVYDLQLTDSSAKTRTFIGGQITVTSDVSE